MRNHARILVVDDEAAMRDACRQVLEREGIEVTEAPSGRGALEALAGRAFQLVILDLKMPGMDGMAVLKEIRREHKETSVIVITGYPSVESAVEAMKCGAIDFLPKPFTRESLRVIVRKALNYNRLEREHGLLVGRLKAGSPPVRMVGETPQMKAIFDLTERVAATDSTVLVMGESGTGKELVARALHEKSPRAKGPFVTVDCATLVGTLFESELFGHVRGSFTGAIATTHGRFEIADGGTLFLDEVGCIDLSIQAKLLRVIEEREFTRVGSNQTVSVDVRLVAATNTDLPQAVSDGTFREDLFYRLSVVPIVLPPLRQRRGDIPLLAEHFLEIHSRSRGKGVTRVSDAAMSMLMERDWPGNVRELSNAIERAVVLAEGDEIQPDHLLQYGFTHRKAPQRVVGQPLSLADVEKVQIERALSETRGNKSRAATILGIDRKTLWRKIRKYGIASR